MFRHAAHSVSDPYREWAPFYPPNAHNDLMRVEEAAALSLMPHLAGRVILDAGSGTGRYGRLAIERGASLVIGVDRSHAMLTRAAASARRIRADFTELPIASASCDVIVSGLALMDVQDLPRVFREWSRVLRPHGVVVCSTLHPRGEALGWTRTFSTPGGGGRLPGHWHSLDRLHAACESAGLVIEAVAEPGLDGLPGEPVALVARARRAG